MTTFDDLNVSPEIRRAILELGFENPMPVQEKVIPLLLGKNNDIIALAQTGTGKTAAYGIPLIQEADSNNPHPQALILCPTRELCMQICGDLKDFALYCDNIKVLPVYGGSSIDTQLKALKRGVQIVVATPGRMLDIIQRKAVRLSNVKRVILDEADEMLNMGFLEDINTILAEVPEERNTLLFSATMPSEIAAISKNYMRNPIEITIGVKNSGAENVKHLCYTVQAKDKYLALKRIADFNPGIYGIVFCRTRRETQEIADKLIADGYNADALHGDLSQAQRDSVMQKFRIKNVKLLIATDVAARGLDVDDITHVINYELPDEYDVYTHRSGRTGRTGKAGISVVIVHLKEKQKLKIIEKKIGKTFIHTQVPLGRDICEKQLFHFVDKMEKVEIDYTQIDSYLPVIFKKLDWLDKEEVIRRFVSLEFNRFIEYYKNSRDINVSEKDKNQFSEKGRGRDRNVEGDFTRLFLNMGKGDGMYPKEIIEMINSTMPDLKVQIGRIDLMKSFSFFEVESRYAQNVIESLCKLKHNNRNVIVDLASDKDSEKSGSDFPKRDNYKRERPARTHNDNARSNDYPKPNFFKRDKSASPFKERQSSDNKPFEKKKRKTDRSFSKDKGFGRERKGDKK